MGKLRWWPTALVCQRVHYLGCLSVLGPIQSAHEGGSVCAEGPGGSGVSHPGGIGLADRHCWPGPRAKIATWLSNVISAIVAEHGWPQRRCKPSRIPISSPSKTVCVSMCTRLNATDLVEPPVTMAATAAMWPLLLDPSVKILTSSIRVCIRWAASSLSLDMYYVGGGERLPGGGLAHVIDGLNIPRVEGKRVN